MNRGYYSQPTEKVTAGTLGALPPMPEGAPANRLGLAQWLTMKEHPLTARVAGCSAEARSFAGRLEPVAGEAGSVAPPAAPPEALTATC